MLLYKTALWIGEKQDKTFVVVFLHITIIRSGEVRKELKGVLKIRVDACNDYFMSVSKIEGWALTKIASNVRSFRCKLPGAFWELGSV